MGECGLWRTLPVVAESFCGGDIRLFGGRLTVACVAGALCERMPWTLHGAVTATAAQRPCFGDVICAHAGRGRWEGPAPPSFYGRTSGAGGRGAAALS